MEVLDIVLRKKVFHSIGKYGRPGGIPFLIGRTTTGESIKGQMRNPIEGQQYRLWGEWKPQKGPYPDAFEFVNYEALCDRSIDGIATYLRKGNIPGIGGVRAQALVDAFGIDTLEILRVNPERALEVNGISEEIIQSIRRHFADNNERLDPAAIAKLIAMFDGYKISMRVIKACVRSWGSAAPEVVRDNPYLLMDMPRMGWKSTDPLATTGLGYADDGEYRQEAAIIASLRENESDGHTCMSKSDMLNMASSLLGGRLNPKYLDSAIRKEYVVASDDGKGVVYQTHSLARAEATVAERLRTLQDQGPSPLIDEGNDYQFAKWTIANRLGADQAAALVMLLNEPVSILTGGPGTGKSYTIARLVMWLLNECGNPSIRCMAPTGKAAKRTAELLAGAGISAIPSTTIHKALAPEPPTAEGEGVPADDAKFGRGREGWAFGRNLDHPLDDSVIICDESSMLDCRLAASLLNAIKSGTRVIFVGDSHQLPSVGPGSVLRDMIAAGIPTATLTEIRRSDSAGTVVHACHAIIRGDIPDPADKIDLAAYKNWVHHEVSSPAGMRDKIVELAGDKSVYQDVFDTQVVSPQKPKLLFACNHLNSVLSQTLNPDGRDTNLLTDPESGEIIDQSGNPKVGDKVVREKNEVIDRLEEMPAAAGRADLIWEGRRYKCQPTAVVNGDMGSVVAVLEDLGCYLVLFRDPDRFVRLPMADAEITLAYAMTVHKCVHPDTLVETPDGIFPIKNLPLIGRIATPSGDKIYRNLVENPTSSALRITTEGGYSITVTPDHGLEVLRRSSDNPEMTPADSITTGDRLLVRLGLTCGPEALYPLPALPIGDIRAVRRDVPGFVDEKVAEFFGLMVADGTVYNRGFRLAKRHAEVRERFAEGCRHLFGIEPKPIEINGTPGYEVSSTLICSWMELIGGLSPDRKDIPECILRSPVRIQAAFLRGLFEDGGVNLNEDGNCDHIEWTSVYPDMRIKVRTMLLRMGIITGDTSYSPYRVYIYGHHALKFAKTIGFITPEKQRRALTAIDTERKYLVPISKDEIASIRRFAGSGSLTKSVCDHARSRGHMSRQVARQIVAEGILPVDFIRLIQDRLRYYYPRVKTIESVECPSMCVEVPDGHRFLQNGFVGSNCQGSGAKRVIIPVSNDFFFDEKTGRGLWCRELFYTAISRTEVECHTVGQWRAIETAIGRKTVHRRQTTLAPRLGGTLKTLVPDEPRTPFDVEPQTVPGDGSDWFH